MEFTDQGYVWIEATGTEDLPNRRTFIRGRRELVSGEKIEALVGELESVAGDETLTMPARAALRLTTERLKELLQA